MSDWILSLEGTEAGHRAALILALMAAFLHAVAGSIPGSAAARLTAPMA